MSDVDQLNKQLSDAKEAVEMRNLALKLASYPEFKKLITHEYLLVEAATQAQLAANINLTPAQRADSMEMAKATGHFKNWLAVIDMKGVNAERQLVGIEEEILLAISEEGVQ